MAGSLFKSHFKKNDDLPSCAIIRNIERTHQLIHLRGTERYIVRRSVSRLKNVVITAMNSMLPMMFHALILKPSSKRL